MFQLEEVGRGDSSVFEPLDQMIENSGWRRPPDPGHSLSSSVLLVENEAFKLLGQFTYLAPIVGRFDSLQQHQHRMIGGVGFRPDVHRLYHPVLFALCVGLVPARANRLTGDLAAFLGSELGGSRRPP